jgi:hypothetical protein
LFYSCSFPFQDVPNGWRRFSRIREEEEEENSESRYTKLPGWSYRRVILCEYQYEFAAGC